MWILDSHGSAIGSTRHAKTIKNVKVSPIEKFLHRMYGGRVYYINKVKSRISIPLDALDIFALNFSPATKKRYRNWRFQDGFTHYDIMNQNTTEIPSFDLLCSEFNGVKIARFYDKNFNNLVKQEILEFSKNLPYCITEKLLIKRIIRQFKKRYDELVIYRALLYLIDKGFLNIHSNLIGNSIKRCYFNFRGDYYK